MQRGGILLAAALMLALSTPPAAADQSGAQPDLMIVSRHGQVLNGDDIYNDTGVGQQRSVTADQIGTTIIVRLQNDGESRSSFVLRGSIDAPGFNVAYLRMTERGLEGDLTSRVAEDGLTWVLRPGQSRRLAIVIYVPAATPLGARASVLVRVDGAGGRDALLIKATNISTPD